jgi:adenylate kinase family enzyme
VYAEETEPLVGYYRSAGKLEDIDGEGSIETVGRALAAVVA